MESFVSNHQMGDFCNLKGERGLVSRNTRLIIGVSYLYKYVDYCGNAGGAAGGRYRSNPGHFCSIK